MAIQKLHTVLEENGLFKEATLQNTYLVIDGGCLVYTLLIGMHSTERFSDPSMPNLVQQLEAFEGSTTKTSEESDARLFGGDYAHFAAIVGAFFDRLEACRITPIIVFDGTFPSEKLSNKQNGFMGRIHDVAEHLQTQQVSSNVQTLWHWHVAHRVINERGLFNIVCSYEADPILVKLATTLGCPLLSTDTDFYIYSCLSGGVIPIWSFLENVFFTEDEYIVCKLYSIDAFLGHEAFAGLSGEMLTLAAPLLGQDLFNHRNANTIVQLIANRTDDPQGDEWKIEKVYTVLRWLKEQTVKGRSFEEVKKMIMKLCDDAMTHFNATSMEAYKLQISQFTASEFTESVELTVPEQFDLSTVDAFFSKNREHFQVISGLVGESLQSQFEHRVLHGQIQSRLLAIALHQVEFSPVLVCDYSQVDAYNQCYFAYNTESNSSLAACIYGFLRPSEETSTVVSVWRQPHKINERNHKEDFNKMMAPCRKLKGRKLPMLSKMAPESRNFWCSRILETLGIEHATLDEAIGGIETLKHLSAHQTTQLRTLMMALNYFSNRSPTKPSLDPIKQAFMRALLANILLVGQIGANYFAIEPIICSEKAENIKLFDIVCSIDDFNVSITHLYQSYQSCLKDLNLLAEILNQEQINADEYLCALQGTFIHNLTLELLSSKSPKKLLKQIFGSEIAKTIQMLLQIVLPTV